MSESIGVWWSPLICIFKLKGKKTICESLRTFISSAVNFNTNCCYEALFFLDLHIIYMYKRIEFASCNIVILRNLTIFPSKSKKYWWTVQIHFLLRWFYIFIPTKKKSPHQNAKQHEQIIEWPQSAGKFRSGAISTLTLSFFVLVWHKHTTLGYTCALLPLPKSSNSLCFQERWVKESRCLKSSI